MPRLGLGAGAYNRWVTLARTPQVSDDADGYEEALDPEGVWCAIRPGVAWGSVSDRSNELLLEMPYHPQVNIDTVIRYEDLSRPEGRTIRRLVVRGVQDINDDHDVLRLSCQEVTP